LVFDVGKLDGKTAVVTGAWKGNAEGIALRMAADGVSL
jgi:NAD(P)-dependent dehydrogenase (short-subunit alcohol dehydrogenase family)